MYIYICTYIYEFLYTCRSIYICTCLHVYYSHMYVCMIKLFKYTYLHNTYTTNTIYVLCIFIHRYISMCVYKCFVNTFFSAAMQIKVRMCVCVWFICIFMCMCRGCQEFVCVRVCEFCLCAGVHGTRTDTLYMYMWVQREKASSSVIETLSV